MLHSENLQLYNEAKKTQSITMAKSMCLIWYTKTNGRKKIGNKDGKALSILMENAVHDKKIEKKKK